MVFRRVSNQPVLGCSIFELSPWFWTGTTHATQTEGWKRCLRVGSCWVLYPNISKRLLAGMFNKIFLEWTKFHPTNIDVQPFFFFNHRERVEAIAGPSSSCWWCSFWWTWRLPTLIACLPTARPAAWKKESWRVKMWIVDLRPKGGDKCGIYMYLYVYLYGASMISMFWLECLKFFECNFCRIPVIYSAFDSCPPWRLAAPEMTLAWAWLISMCFAWLVKDCHFMSPTLPLGRKWEVGVETGRQNFDSASQHLTAVLAPILPRARYWPSRRFVMHICPNQSVGCMVFCSRTTYPWRRIRYGRFDSLDKCHGRKLFAILAPITWKPDFW